MGNLCIDRVSKHFGNVPVLRGVDCSIEHGEFIGVVGPSGCGKTTLLRLIAGLEDVSEGEIRIDGKVVNDFMPRDRNIAMVFQNYALYPHKTVYENLAYSLRLRKAPRDEITSRVKWAAEVLQIESLLQRRPSQLSGGQRQRVAMGRAIVRQPSVFLFDEPLSNLDANLRSAMRIELRKLHVRLGITSVYVTHDQTEAMTLADRLIVLRAGQIEQFDIPAAIYDRPASSFVGRFIGSPPMNLIGGIVDEDARMLVVNGGASVRLPSGYRLRAGQEVTIGVRPERLRLGGNGLAVFDIRVELLEMLGADSFLHGALATRGGDLAIVARVDRHCAVSSGERVSLNADPVDMHLFDARSDRRIEAVAA